MNYSRRDFSKLALAAVPFAGGFAATNSTFNGVRIGVCSFSFRGWKLDDVVSQVAAIPIGELELESVFVEPGNAMSFPAPGAGGARGASGRAGGGGGRAAMTPEQREALRNWRLSVSLDEFRAIRKKFDDNGIHVYAYNIPINDTFTDEEIDRVFQMAQALGVQAVNVVTTLPVAPRLITPSARYKMRVGFHPSGITQTPDSIGNGDSYRKVIALAPNFGVNPDLHQNANWGPDPLAFIREMHDRLTTIHTHDTAIADVPGGADFGHGQMPIRAILELIRNEKYNFVPMIERPANPDAAASVAELRKCVQYCKDVLG